MFSTPSLPHVTPRELGSVDEILGPLTAILEGVLQADQQLMEKTKAKVFAAFITVLQMKEMKGEGQWSAGSDPPALLGASLGRASSSLELDITPLGVEISVLQLLFSRKLFIFLPSFSSPLMGQRLFLPGKEVLLCNKS